MKNSPKEYAIIAGASAIAGSRTMLAPALANPGNKLLTVMAVMELCGDKVPGVGNRIAIPGLIGRSISGAITGVTLSRRGTGSNVSYLLCAPAISEENGPARPAGRAGGRCADDCRREKIAGQIRSYYIYLTIILILDKIIYSLCRY